MPQLVWIRQRLQPQILRNFTVSTEPRASPMCSLKQPTGTYLCSKVKAPLPGKEIFWLLAKQSEGSRSRPGTQRQGGRGFPRQCQDPAAAGSLAKGFAVGAVTLGESPRLSEPCCLQHSSANGHRSPGRNSFPCSGSSCPGTAVPEDRGAHVPVPSLAQTQNHLDLSQYMDLSIITITVGAKGKCCGL